MTPLVARTDRVSAEYTTQTKNGHTEFAFELLEQEADEVRERSLAANCRDFAVFSKNEPNTRVKRVIERTLKLNEQILQFRIIFVDRILIQE